MDGRKSLEKDNSDPDSDEKEEKDKEKDKEKERKSLKSRENESDEDVDSDEEEEEATDAEATMEEEEEEEEEEESATPFFKKKKKKKSSVLEEVAEEVAPVEISLLDRHDSELTPKEIIEKDIMMYELLMAEEDLMEMEVEEKVTEVVQEVVVEEEEEEVEEEEEIIVSFEEEEVVEEVVVEEPPAAELDADFMALFNQAAEEDEEDDLKTLYFGGLASTEQDVDALDKIDGVIGITLSDKTKEFLDLEDMTEMAQKITWISFKQVKLHMYIYKDQSEFFPYYDSIKHYPEISMLLGLDVTKQTGHEYYLCLTMEARNRVLNPPKKKQVFLDLKKKEEEMWNDMASIAPRKWRTQGSELEVAEENVYEFRPLLEVHVSRVREKFGDVCPFSDMPLEGNPNAYVCFESEDPAKYPFVEITEIDRSVQVMPQKSTVSTQTGFFFKRNKTTQHEIQSIQPEEAETIMKSESLKQFFQKSLVNLLVNLQQNSMMDVAGMDYQRLRATKGNESEFNNDALVLKEFQTYSDMRHSKGRCVTQMMFHPTLDDVVVLSVAEDATFDKRIESHSKVLMEPNFVLFWDLKEASHPQIMLDAPADVFSFQVNPSDPHLVCGGCANGQIALWDLGRVFTELRNKLQNRRKKSMEMDSGTKKPDFLEKLKDTAEKYACPLIRPCGLSNLEQSHKRVVTSVAWVPSHVEIGKNGTLLENSMGGRSCQFYSIAGDSTLRLWDTRPSKLVLADFEEEDAKNPIKNNPWLHLENNQWKFSTKCNLDDGTGTMYATLMTLSEAKVGDTIKVQDQVPVVAPTVSTVSDLEKVHSDSEKLGEKSKNTMSSHSLSKQSMIAIPENKPPVNLGVTQSTIFIGTEVGQICFVDWFRNKDGTINLDSGNKTCQNHYVQCYHDGAITSISRSPFFYQLILVIGGGTVSIWNEKCPYPVLQSHGGSLFPWCGAWSNTRPGVFFCGTSEGSVQVWDLLDRSNAPVFTQQVSAGRITDICVPKTTTSKKHFVALSDSEGVLFVLIIPRYYVKPLNLEQNTMKELMNREEKRMNSWVADQEGRLEKLEAVHGSFKGHKKLKTNEESNLEEILQEERLAKEYIDFVEFETKLVNKLKREEPTLPTVDDDIAEEFDRLLKNAEESAREEEERATSDDPADLILPPDDYAF